VSELEILAANVRITVKPTPRTLINPHTGEKQTAIFASVDEAARKCDICELPLTGEMIGNGDGTGQRFAHPDCYYRKQSERYEAEAAELRAENAVLTHNIRETMGLVKSFRIERDELQAENARLLAERDALRARIEAGRVMYGGMYGHQNKFEMWTFEHVDTDTMQARLIDIAPLSDAGDVDERKGDRRKGEWEYCECRKDLSTFCLGSTDFCWRPINESPRRAARDNRRDAARSNERRRTPGTRAMRGQG
jgi:hypothetical protein